MVSFAPVDGSRLYQSDSNAAAGWWGFQLGSGVQPVSGGDSITLTEALESSALQGTFVYTATTPHLAGDGTKAFIDQVDRILSTIINKRALIFLASGKVASEVEASALVIPLSQDANRVRTNGGPPVTLTGVAGVNASIAAGAVLTAAKMGDAIILDGGNSPALSLTGSSAPQSSPSGNTAALRFTGADMGSVCFSLSIQRQSLSSNLNWGFQFLIPNSNQGQPILYLAAWLPFADPLNPSPTDMLGFNAQINLVNPNNLIAASKTVFWFTGQNAPGSQEAATTLASYYRTAFGKSITLYPVTDGQQPAGLVINPGYVKTPLQNGFRFAPVGDFALGAAPIKGNAEPKMLCGLSGSEAISFLPRSKAGSDGYHLRFFPNRPAYVAQFPIQAASPVGTPIDPKALLLNNRFLTSWATVVPPPGDASSAHYAAAPKGADLFGHEDIVAVDGLLGSKDPGVALPAASEIAFPLNPFYGFQPGTGDQDVTAAQMDLIERQILSPTRRNQITSSGAVASGSARASMGRLVSQGAEAPFNTTTPTGFIARVDNGQWTELLLGQTTDAGGAVDQQVGFTKLNPDLQAAFQSDNLFLVAANATLLGKASEGKFPPPPSAESEFFNAVGMSGWSFKAQVGQDNTYGDYRNVLIVKGTKGKLTDLARSPNKWTMKDRFAAPTVKLADGSLSAPDVSQLIPLSSWLDAYFQAAAAEKDNPYFSNFAQIVNDDNWTGVLLLKANIAAIPADLAGIAAGIQDPSAFFAHHIGIEVSQVDGKAIAQKGASSLFGLIYYVDPRYDDSLPPHALAPNDLNADYDFTLLTLKALFQNSAIKKFDSVAQLVLNQLFGSRVDHMGDGGNIYNAILLQGAFQKNGNTAVYSLSSRTANTYYLANNIFTKVEIDTAEMSTRNQGAKSGTTSSWIAMSGYMAFAVIVDPSGKEPDFDIFSFGSDKNADMPRQGLNFSNLGLLLTFPNQTKNNRAEAQGKTLSMVESEISFNVSVSRNRENSIYQNLQLQLLSLQSGVKESTPSTLGYLPVATRYGLQGVDGSGWHGLRFQLNLGTPGALASKINLTSSLLVSWSDSSGAETGSGYQASVGLELPGTGSGGDLFSLQTVIKLSVGTVQLFYSDKNKSFLLLLNEIALKLLGLISIPPNGATAFYLFGIPNATDSTGLGWYAIYNQEQKTAQAALR